MHPTQGDRRPIVVVAAMAYVLDHRGDYDCWGDAGLPQWSYAHILPYFRRQRPREEGSGPYRGGGGLFDALVAATRPDP